MIDLCGVWSDLSIVQNKVLISAALSTLLDLFYIMVVTGTKVRDPNTSSNLEIEYTVDMKYEIRF